MMAGNRTASGRRVGVEHNGGPLNAGRDLLENSSHLPPIVGSRLMYPVIFAPGWDRVATNPPRSGLEVSDGPIAGDQKNPSRSA